MKALIDAVYLHALHHYNESGWDYVVECWGDDDILDIIKGCTSEEEAINTMLAYISPLAAMRDDIRGHGGLND